MTKRLAILEAVKANLESIRFFKSVKIDNLTPIDIQKTPFPCAFIYGGAELAVKDSRANIGFETWDWSVIIEVWGKGLDLDQVLCDIHTAMYANNRLNGLARYSFRANSEPFLVDDSLLVGGMSITYQVLYGHPNGQMDNLS